MCAQWCERGSQYSENWRCVSPYGLCERRPWTYFPPAQRLISQHRNPAHLPLAVAKLDDGDTYSVETAVFTELNTRCHEPEYRSLNILLLNLMCVCPCIVDDVGRERPTRCYTIVYWTYDSLNMFRAPLCPSSGAWDYTDVHSMWHVTLVMVGFRCGVWL
jgi:hypothetical protein